MIVNERYELGRIVCGVPCLVERHELPVQTRYISAYAYRLGGCRCAKYYDCVGIREGILYCIIIYSDTHDR